MPPDCFDGQIPSGKLKTHADNRYGSSLHRYFTALFCNFEYVNSPSHSNAIVEKNEKNAKLIIVGIGNYENKIRELVNKLSLRNIKFAGAIEHDRIPEIINCADVFVLSSKYEGSPTVVKEALACGLPVVSTNVGDVSELIKNGKTGYVVNSRTSEEFASRILDILGSENSFTTDCVNTAMKYSWENIARDTLEVYREA